MESVSDMALTPLPSLCIAGAKGSPRGDFSTWCGPRCGSPDSSPYGAGARRTPARLTLRGLLDRAQVSSMASAAA